jgi:type IV pilus assembly protein PilC
MSNYAYEAVDANGLQTHGSLAVDSQAEALRRIKEMGLFPIRVKEAVAAKLQMRSPARSIRLPAWMIQRSIKPVALAAFTRQLATLSDVGMPLLRGLRLLREQEDNSTMRRILTQVASTVETGGTLSEALMAHPKVFNGLYVNMVKAGEAGGILELVLRRQAEFMEKALKIKSKIKAAMFYPIAVMFVAVGIIALMLLFIIPRFQTVFEGLQGGKPLPAFTLAVLHVSQAFKNHFVVMALVGLALFTVFQFSIRTKFGRRWFDQLKLVMPAVGKVSRKVALSRFARTLGTLLGSGVPILQALAIVKETVGNVVVGKMVGQIHENVKEGGTLAEPLKSSRVFPPMIAGMVDVGEQTGALPDMLLKIADTSDEEVDNAVTALTSLLEPVMIVFLAVVVGSIVIAMFLPILGIINEPGFGGAGN